MLRSGEHSGPAFEQAAERAVQDIVRKQVENGVDVVNDGEQAKVSFATYVTERLTGFESESRPRELNIEQRMFSEYYGARMATLGIASVVTCAGPITWKGDEQVQRDIANFKTALAGVPVADAFMTAASPGVIWYYQPNAFYPSHEAYIMAAAEAMKPEYDAIYRAGFVLQLDCPDLAGGWNKPEFTDKTMDDFRRMAQIHVDALNHATRDIPPDRMRLHVCWGNLEGPHVRDIPLARILDILLTARPAALSIEGANPRHEHEWKVFRETKLPDGKILIPGILDSTTNFVEHPELVAERIIRYASVVGKENLIAGADCGFATLARAELPIHPTVTWVKLQALAEGAKLASRELW